MILAAEDLGSLHTRSCFELHNFELQFALALLGEHAMLKSNTHAYKRGGQLPKSLLTKITLSCKMQILTLIKHVVC